MWKREEEGGNGRVEIARRGGNLRGMGGDGKRWRRVKMGMEEGRDWKGMGRGWRLVGVGGGDWKGMGERWRLEGGGDGMGVGEDWKGMGRDRDKDNVHSKISIKAVIFLN